MTNNNELIKNVKPYKVFYWFAHTGHLSAVYFVKMGENNLASWQSQKSTCKKHPDPLFTSIVSISIRQLNNISRTALKASKKTAW